MLHTVPFCRDEGDIQASNVPDFSRSAEDGTARTARARARKPHSKILIANPKIRNL